jgi:hypothetical protein
MPHSQCLTANASQPMPHSQCLASSKIWLGGTYRSVHRWLLSGPNTSPWFSRSGRFWRHSMCSYDTRLPIPDQEPGNPETCEGYWRGKGKGKRSGTLRTKCWIHGASSCNCNPLPQAWNERLVGSAHQRRFHSWRHILSHSSTIPPELCSPLDISEH